MNEPNLCDCNERTETSILYKIVCKNCRRETQIILTTSGTISKTNLQIDIPAIYFYVRCDIDLLYQKYFSP